VSGKKKKEIINLMNPFIYLSGADPLILKQSSSRSNSVYAFTGFVISLFIVGTFNFFFSNIILFYALPITITFSMLLTLTMLFFLYLVLIVSEPSKVKRTNLGEVYFSRFLRFIILSIDLFILIKFLELRIYFLLYDIQTNSLVDLLEELITLNELNPFLWIISTILFAFFISPFVLKFLVNNEYDYFNQKRELETQLIETSKEEFLVLRNHIHSMTYNKYKGKKTFDRQSDSIRNDSSNDDDKLIGGRKEFLFNWRKSQQDGK
jgi:hypothetical protein